MNTKYNPYTFIFPLDSVIHYLHYIMQIMTKNYKIQLLSKIF